MTRKILLGREPNTTGWHYLATVTANEDSMVLEKAAKKRASLYTHSDDPADKYVERYRKQLKDWDEHRVVTVAEAPDGKHLDETMAF